jgi:hypothetical protein
MENPLTYVICVRIIRNNPYKTGREGMKDAERITMPKRGGELGFSKNQH